MASVVEICNRALQMLGQPNIVSLSDNSAAARAVALAYPVVRDAELEKRQWNFSIKRASLAEEVTVPAWGRAHQYQLPTDFLALADDYEEDRRNDKDWAIEGRFILTNDGSPLYLRYVAQITDVAQMPATFREAVSSRLAETICEKLTQSNSKKTALEGDYDKAIREARRANAFNRRPGKPPEDEYITCRA